MIRISSLACAALLMGGTYVHAVEAQRETFGEIDGATIDAVVLRNHHGMRARIIAYGAAIQLLEVPDRKAQIADVVLSYPDISGFIAQPQYFGATIGRFANRIAHGSFTLDGQRFTIPPNDGQNSLHGGPRGFDKAIWHVDSAESGAVASTTLSYVSADGDQGYPGELRASVRFELNEKNDLTIRYHATASQPTIVNLTNHSYFNLSGADSGRDVLDERLTLLASRYTPVDDELIPTGEMRAVLGTAFDFLSGQPIGSRIGQGSDVELVRGRGYDHNWVLDAGQTSSPKLAARLVDPWSGRVMEVWTTEPGLQFYSGNFLNGTVVGKGGRIYRQSGALCLEPQNFPDAPNHPGFPSARLNPGQTYQQTSIYRFRTLEARRKHP